MQTPGQLKQSRQATGQVVVWIVEVVFTFTHRKNEFTEKYSARVDVNDEFPFLSSKMAPYTSTKTEPV
jgi:hypothetical protein